MKILIVTETLSVGGAETFVLRLANRLSQQHEVVLANLHPRFSHPEMVSKISHPVNYQTPKYSGRKILDKLDSAMLHAGIDYNTGEQTIIAFLAGLIRQHQPDAVHSHLFNADYYVARARGQAGLAFSHVTTNHGDYLLYERKPPARILNYGRKMLLAMSSINHFVNISDEQMDFTGRHNGDLPGTLQVHKILNGYESETAAGRGRATLGIPENAFVFGMVARGIPEKGWAQLTAAFHQAAIPNSYLVLVGEGPAMAGLRATCEADSRIIFAGFSANPLEYIRLFDVGVLPSYYAAESLPTVIIEYLYCGKPVIATDVGEIALMIADDQNNAAGLLIPLKDARPDVTVLAAAMQSLATDKEAYGLCQSRTPGAFSKFDMDTCVSKYLALYRHES